MGIFNLFLAFFTLLLSVTSLVLVYLAIDNCRESAFVPIYYFLGLSLASSLVFSLARIGELLFNTGFILSSALLQDLFISYVVLFLFGSLWQSYEAELCVPSFVETKD